MAGSKGQDWASYQSSTPSTEGLAFAFCKVTEGLSYVNPKWVAQRDHAKKAGLVWGAYHYPHMANDPIAEADYFLKQVTWKPGDIIVLDWEGYDSANKGVPNSRKVAYRDAWLRHVKGEMPNHAVGIYSNVDYWLNLDKTSNCGDFLWIATGGKPAGEPGIKYNWLFHQYSTAGNIDHDYCRLTKSELKAWSLSFGEEKPEPTKNPPTSTQPAPAPKFPGRQYFRLGAKNKYAKQLQTWLEKGHWGPAYKVGPSETMAQIDIDKVKALQRHYLSALGPADGLAGPKTWQYAYEVAVGRRKK